MIILKLTNKEAETLEDELDLHTDLMEEDLTNPTPPAGFDDKMRAIYEEDFPKLRRILHKLSREIKKEKRDAIKARKLSKKT